MRLEPSWIEAAYREQLEDLHVTGDDVARISVDAYMTYCKRAKTFVEEDDLSCIIEGIEKAFANYDSTKKTRFTTYLHSCVQGSVKDYLRSCARAARRNRKALYLVHPESFPLHQYIEERDFCDIFGKILWRRNRMELLVLFLLLELGYTNSEISRFMMKDEKQIRRWRKALADIANEFLAKENVHA
jgi:DNA-directed RNA polymerase specialized sigma24 family protein